MARDDTRRHGQAREDTARHEKARQSTRRRGHEGAEIFPTHKIHICSLSVSKQSSIKKSFDEKSSGSHRQEKVVDSIWSCVPTALNLKENGFLSVTIMVCPQNEPHSLPKGNPDNIHEADSA